MTNELEGDAHKWQTYTMLRDMAHAAERIVELEEECESSAQEIQRVWQFVRDERQKALADVLALQRWHLRVDEVDDAYVEEYMAPDPLGDYIRAKDIESLRGGRREMKRALRRHHYKRLKKKRAAHYGGWAGSSPRNAGLVANTAQLCSCWMCGNPRRRGEKTRQETLRGEENND